MRSAAINHTISFSFFSFFFFLAPVVRVQNKEERCSPFVPAQSQRQRPHNTTDTSTHAHAHAITRTCTRPLPPTLGVNPPLCWWVSLAGVVQAIAEGIEGLRDCCLGKSHT